jgi:hypothetical protein
MTMGVGLTWSFPMLPSDVIEEPSLPLVCHVCYKSIIADSRSCLHNTWFRNIAYLGLSACSGSMRLKDRELPLEMFTGGGPNRRRMVSKIGRNPGAPIGWGPTNWVPRSPGLEAVTSPRVQE